MSVKYDRLIKNWKSPELFEMPEGTFIENAVSKGRRFLPFSYAKFREEAFSDFKIQQLHEEPMFKNFIGNHYLDGAFTHPHIDNAPSGFVHVRCNWLIKKPEEGGNPVINNKEIITEAGDLWICFSSKELHSSTPIKNGERLICSFGALVPEIILDYRKY
jgi:hypothetical protein